MTTTVTKDDLAAQSTDNGQAVSDTTKYTGEFEGTFTGTLVGNATTAKELEKPYNFTLSGDASGTVAVNASSVILETTVNQATHANTADFAGKTNLAARSTLADMANTAEFSYRAGKLTKLFVNITGACVGSGSATDTDTIDINIDNINVAELFIVGALPEEKANTSRIYVDISNRHFWIYNNDTAKWYDCFEQLETELDNHELRIADLEKLDLSNRVTSLETRADANDTTNADFEKRITKNTDDISSLDTRVTSIEDTSNIGQFSTRMTAVENKISDIETKDIEQDKKLTTNTDAIAENKTAIAENKTACDNANTALDTRVTAIENGYVTLDTEQTITGAKTFSIITKSATPSASASGTEVVTAAWTRSYTENKWQDVATEHNNIYRGANLLNGHFSSISDVISAISKGDFSDIYVGDYIPASYTVDSSTVSTNFRIAGINTLKARGGAWGTQNTNVCIVPDQLGTSCMNDSNTTAGGYVGSKMYTTILPKYYKALAGSTSCPFYGHILTTTERLTNSVDTSKTCESYSGNYGVANGISDYANQNLTLMSEVEVYGCKHWSSCGWDDESMCVQLPLFRLKPEIITQNGNQWFWLRSVSFSAAFCLSGGALFAAGNVASGVCGVRPRFFIG